MWVKYEKISNQSIDWYFPFNHANELKVNLSSAEQSGEAP